MEFSTEDHHPFAIDEERLFIPGHLEQSIPSFPSGAVTYTLLEQFAFRRVGMLGDGITIEPVADRGTQCLTRQQGGSTDGEKLHGVCCTMEEIKSNGSGTDYIWAGEHLDAS